MSSRTRPPHPDAIVVTRPKARSVDVIQRETERTFYDQFFHRSITASPRLTPTTHHRRLARRIGVGAGQSVLDVACGAGEWLGALAESGATPLGLDLSWRALHACSSAGITKRLCVGHAAELPFSSGAFDSVTCLGALEHFSDPGAALKELVRVSRPRATFLFLVPNANFLPRTLGVFSGTEQTNLRETPRTIPAWQELFRSAGLETVELWKDLHIVSWRWIFSKRPIRRLPIRALAAALLITLPLAWQYQIYFRCCRNVDSTPR